MYLKVPNLLTLSRLLLAAIMMVLLSVSFLYAKTFALLLFILAGITDYLDGYLARRVYGVSAFGRLMDPLTDKVLVCMAFIAFVELRVLPAWIAVIIVSREFLVTGLRLLAANRGEIISAGRWGKHKTVWQIIVIGLLLIGVAIRDDFLRYARPSAIVHYDMVFGYIALAISVAVTLLTMVSGGMYFYEHRQLISED